MSLKAKANKFKELTIKENNMLLSHMQMRGESKIGNSYAHIMQQKKALEIIQNKPAIELLEKEIELHRNRIDRNIKNCREAINELYTMPVTEEIQERINECEDALKEYEIKEDFTDEEMADYVINARQKSVNGALVMIRTDILERELDLQSGSVLKYNFFDYMHKVPVDDIAGKTDEEFSKIVSQVKANPDMYRDVLCKTLAEWKDSIYSSDKYYVPSFDDMFGFKEKDDVDFEHVSE